MGNQLSSGNPISTFSKTLGDVRKNDPSYSELDFTNFKLGDSKISQLTDAAPDWLSPSGRSWSKGSLCNCKSQMQV